jgi:hypothetical protein
MPSLVEAGRAHHGVQDVFAIDIDFESDVGSLAWTVERRAHVRRHPGEFFG